MGEILSLNQTLVQILLHELEDKCQFTYIHLSFTSGLIVEHLDQLDDVIVGGEEFECLNFFEFFDFLNGLEFLFHALDSYVLAGLEGVGHEDLGKGAVAALGLKSVLIHRNKNASKD